MNKGIAVCGYSEKKDDRVIYSEFTLSNCSTLKEIAQWDATQNCLLAFNSDTLTVTELFILPVGNQFSYKEVPFRISKFYYKGNLLYRSDNFNVTLKYTQQQITDALAQYASSKKGNTEDNLQVVESLFWAYVSGSEDAEKLFIQSKEKLARHFDGAIAEENNRVQELYLTHKQQNDKTLQTIVE